MRTSPSRIQTRFFIFPLIRPIRVIPSMQRTRIWFAPSMRSAIPNISLFRLFGSRTRMIASSPGLMFVPDSVFFLCWEFSARNLTPLCGVHVLCADGYISIIPKISQESDRNREGNACLPVPDQSFLKKDVRIYYVKFDVILL